MPDEIPTIDLRSPEATTDLMAAYTTIGFARLVGHGVPDALVTEVFEASRAFHESPAAVKDAVALDARHRGYIALASSTDRASELGAAAHPNQSESFIVMGDSPTDPDRFLSGPDQWPDLAGFRAPVEAYAGAMAGLARDLVVRFATALGAPELLQTAFAHPTTWLRLLHYPARPATTADVYGSAPHVDFGAVTLLAQDDVGGLQVRMPDGTWGDVEPAPGSFILNTGEMMRRWSGGRLLATPHRVVNRPDADRYSVAYFYDPDMRATVEPVAGSAAKDRRIEPVRFDGYVRSQLDATYDQRREP